MKRKNVKLGQHVIVKRSTSYVWNRAADHIGEEFRVAAVECLDYVGGATVMVESVISEGPLQAEFWCNHRDLKRVKPEPAPRPFKVGDKVRVVNNQNLFPVGTVGTITADDGIDAPLPFKVEAYGACWYYPKQDIELCVENGRSVCK